MFVCSYGDSSTAAAVGGASGRPPPDSRPWKTSSQRGETEAAEGVMEEELKASGIAGSEFWRRRWLEGGVVGGARVVGGGAVWGAGVVGGLSLFRGGSAAFCCYAGFIDACSAAAPRRHRGGGGGCGPAGLGAISSRPRRGPAVHQ